MSERSRRTRDTLIAFARTLGAAGLADRAAAAWAAYRARRANAAYRANHPGRLFPNPRLVFATQGYCALESFDRSGRAHAAAIASILRAEGVKRGARVLDWGCGLARVSAHLSAALDDPDLRLSACDPDSRAIAWARMACPRVAFAAIAPDPPTAYAPGAFDAIYGLSVLTHLDEAGAHAWTREIARLLAPDGVAILTSHGEAAAGALTRREQARFEAGRYVVRGGARRGSRAFAAYMNEAAARGLFASAFADVARVSAAETAIGAHDVWRLKAPRPAAGA